MSDSGGRFKFLKKFSSKVDKLFLGDMIQSNSSDYNSSKNSLEFEDYNQDFRENNQEFEDYNSGFRENNQKFIESNPDKVENYSNNSFENRFEYSSKNNVNNDSNINSNYINHNFNNNFEDKYSDYIYVDEFDDFNRNSNFQDKFGNNFQDLRGGFQDDLMHGGNYYDDNYYNNDLGKKNSKIKDFSFSLKNLKNKLLNFNNSSKKNFGLIAISLIILVLGASVFYFGIYQPFQNELDTEKTAKLNELNTLYKGPLALNSHVYTLENQIKDSYDVNGVKSIDVLRIATEDWRAYHGSKINAFEDAYGRIMMSYCENNSEKVLMPTVDAKLFVNENDAKILSNIGFEKVDTVIVPIYISRLQATGGLISVGSIVDIYSLSSNATDYSSSLSEDENNNLNNNSDNNGEENFVDGNEDSEENNNNENVDVVDGLNDASDSKTIEEEPDVSGATVLAILRSKDSGVVDSSFSKSTNLIKGNTTYPTEHSSSFSTDAEELLKSSIFKGHDNNALSSYLDNYGIKLSNYERLSNIGELDTDYLVLLEVPRSDVDFVINNMENLILTIPTEYAPNWAINELNETYYEELANENNYF